MGVTLVVLSPLALALELELAWPTLDGGDVLVSSSLRFLDGDEVVSWSRFCLFFCRLRSACERTTSAEGSGGCGASESPSSASLASVLSWPSEPSDVSSSTCFLFLVGAAALLDSEDDPDDEEGML